MTRPMALNWASMYSFQSLQNSVPEDYSGFVRLADRSIQSPNGRLHYL